MLNSTGLRLWAAKFVLAFLLLVSGTHVLARPVELRRDFLPSAPPHELDGATAGQLRHGWTWLALRSTAPLTHLPANWRLTVDQARFARMAVVLIGKNGTASVSHLSADQVSNNWALGGRLQFTMASSGADVAQLYIGFAAIDSMSLMRSVQAATTDDFAQQQQNWLLLIGIYIGVLLSALVYNFFLFFKQRQVFQLWYVAWVSAALAYGVVWTHVAAFIDPAVTGPSAVRADYVLVALAVALGSTFFLSIVEPGKLAANTTRLVSAAAIACIALGALASNERIFDAALTDRLFNLAMLAAVGSCLVAVGQAWAKGSRVARLFVVGWTPVVLAFGARSARNFGLVPQSDWVDMATFASIAFESLMFSLAVAGRFADLREERDRADERTRELMVETHVLRRAAQIDHLTGLSNRSVFHPRLDELVSSNSRFTLYLIDVDYLKELNDREGHRCGDAALAYLGDRLKELSNPQTCVARIGGDEFAILVEGRASEQTRIHQLLEELQNRRWAHNGFSGLLSLSIGSLDCAEPTSAQEAIRQADTALYHAKNSGRGIHKTFDADLRARTLGRAEAVPQAWAGLKRNEFLFHFQPIVDLKTSRVVSLEALVRWQHPERGLLTPDAFLDLLQEDGIGPALQERILLLAIDEMEAGATSSCTLAVNFTAMDLRGEAAATRLLEQLAERGVSPSALCVEVTESILLDRSAHEPINALRKLHAAGVRIALDDFGTGYASLVHLKTVPVDTLKIDRSFVRGLLDEGGENEQIVRAIIALGQGLGKSVVAEGIESVPQLRKLHAMGCDFGQGYLFGRPSQEPMNGSIHLGDLRFVA